jgi:hypothetical protein
VVIFISSLTSSRLRVKPWLWEKSLYFYKEEKRVMVMGDQ